MCPYLQWIIFSVLSLRSCSVICRYAVSTMTWYWMAAKLVEVPSASTMLQSSFMYSKMSSRPVIYYFVRVHAFIKPLLNQSIMNQSARLFCRKTPVVFLTCWKLWTLEHHHMEALLWVRWVVVLDPPDPELIHQAVQQLVKLSATPAECLCLHYFAPAVHILLALGDCEHCSQSLTTHCFNSIQLRNQKSVLEL